jgi:hypothetical protein
MPTQLTSYAIELSTFAVVAAFTDENGDPVIPDSVAWSLVDSTGTVINSLADQSETPASTVTIVLSGDDLQLLDQSNASELRYLEISAVIDTDLGDNLPLKDRAEFKVINLQSIS